MSDKIMLYNVATGKVVAHNPTLAEGRLKQYPETWKGPDVAAQKIKEFEAEHEPLEDQEITPLQEIINKYTSKEQIIEAAKEMGLEVSKRMGIKTIAKKILNQNT